MEDLKTTIISRAHYIKGLAIGAAEICALVREVGGERAEKIFILFAEQMDQLIEEIEGWQTDKKTSAL